MSAGPPAGNGTISLIGRLGKACAQALDERMADDSIADESAADETVAAISAQISVRRFIIFLPRVFQLARRMRGVSARAISRWMKTRAACATLVSARSKQARSDGVRQSRNAWLRSAAARMRPR